MFPLKLVRKHPFGVLASFLVGVAILISWIYVSAGRGYDWLYFDSLAAFLKSSWFHYGRFPLHDPWVCSGTSVLANPQNWIFSPSVLFTILLDPTIGNWLSFAVFKVIGFVGMVFFLRQVRVDVVPAWLLAAVAVNLNWFSLHLSEGHIVYRSFYLIPWIFYLDSKIRTSSDRSPYWILLFFLLGVMLLDGGAYAFIFSTVFLVFAFMFWPREYVTSVRCSLEPFGFGLIGFLLMTSVKTIPVLAQAKQMKEVQEKIDVPVETLFDVFLNPFLSNGDAGLGYLRFHEFGSYLGWSSVILLVGLLFFLKFSNKTVWFYFVGALAFFWMGSGWGGEFNPYTILSSLPLIKKAHVQTRYFIMMSLLLLTCFGMFISMLPRYRNVFVAALIFLNAEVLLSNWYSYSTNVPEYRLPLITKTDWVATIPAMRKPEIYYTENLVSRDCYEPAQTTIFSVASGDFHYKGEIYGTEKSTSISDITLVPGQIRFAYVVGQDSKVKVNQNYLEGWESSSGAQVQNSDGVIEVSVPAGKGTMVLNYHPFYWPWILILYSAGIAVFTWSFLRRRSL